MTDTPVEPGHPRRRRRSARQGLRPRARPHARPDRGRPRSPERRRRRAGRGGGDDRRAGGVRPLRRRPRRLAQHRRRLRARRQPDGRPEPARRRGGGAGRLRLADHRGPRGDGAHAARDAGRRRARRPSRARRAWSRSTIPSTWFTHGGRRAGITAADLATGTVGCVALDQSGALAAGTSTGGVFGKLPAASATARSLGRESGPTSEWRSPAPARARCSSAPPSPPRSPTACGSRAKPSPTPRPAALADVAALGGEGGLIALTARASWPCPTTPPA